MTNKKTKYVLLVIALIVIGAAWYVWDSKSSVSSGTANLILDFADGDRMDSAPVVPVHVDLYSGTSIIASSNSNASTNNEKVVFPSVLIGTYKARVTATGYKTLDITVSTPGADSATLTSFELHR